jgi:hypothetical protein
VFPDCDVWQSMHCPAQISRWLAPIPTDTPLSPQLHTHALSILQRRYHLASDLSSRTHLAVARVDTARVLLLLRRYVLPAVRQRACIAVDVLRLHDAGVGPVASCARLSLAALQALLESMPVRDSCSDRVVDLIVSACAPPQSARTTLQIESLCRAFVLTPMVSAAAWALGDSAFQPDQLPAVAAHATDATDELSDEEELDLAEMLQQGVMARRAAAWAMLTSRAVTLLVRYVTARYDLCSLTSLSCVSL